ncbi:hypothetical protein Hanom_Chr14g01302391 [Helianthus anomalus]
MISVNRSKYVNRTMELGASFWDTGITSDHSGPWLIGCGCLSCLEESIPQTKMSITIQH